MGGTLEGWMTWVPWEQIWWSARLQIWFKVNSDSETLGWLGFHWGSQKVDNLVFLDGTSPIPNETIQGLPGYLLYRCLEGKSWPWPPKVAITGMLFQNGSLAPRYPLGDPTENPSDPGMAEECLAPLVLPCGALAPKHARQVANMHAQSLDLPFSPQVLCEMEHQKNCILGNLQQAGSGEFLSEYDLKDAFLVSNTFFLYFSASQVNESRALLLDQRSPHYQTLCVAWLWATGSKLPKSHQNQMNYIYILTVYSSPVW